MPHNHKPVTKEVLGLIDQAQGHMRMAKELLVKADAKHAATCVRDAIVESDRAKHFLQKRMEKAKEIGA